MNRTNGVGRHTSVIPEAPGLSRGESSQANPPVNPIHTRSVNHTIAASTRQTIDVDHDLNTSQTGTHITAAAIVQVTNNVPIVVERPWYFNNLGVATGTDAFGVTIPQKNYYFAEAASLKANKVGQPAYNSYLDLYQMFHLVKVSAFSYVR